MHRAVKEKLQSAWRDASPALLLSLAAIFVVAFLVARSTGVYATIMWDEWEYNRFARQLPLSTADVPYYLYYLLYGGTRLCGDGYLGCVQLLNALFYAAAMPFIYLVCRRTAPAHVSVFIAFASIMGGISVYSAHFLPEPMYFCLFWLFAWGVLRAVDMHAGAARLGACAGAMLAVLSLVKLHAMFLIPGMLLYICLCGYGGVLGGGVRRCAATALALLAAFFAVRLSLGYLLAGPAGLNIFGSTYGGNAKLALMSPAAALDLLRRAAPLFLDHVMAVIAMFALPVLLALHLRRVAGDAESRAIFSLQAFTLCLLLPLFAVVAFYSAYVRELNPATEGSEFVRLHLRYYNFLFPLLMILTAAVASHSSHLRAFSPARLLAAVAAGAIMLVFAFHLGHYQLSVADGPELRGFATLAPIRWLLILAGLAALAAYAWDAVLAARIYLLAFFPLFVLMGAAAAALSAHKEQTPTVYHRAGMFARAYLGGDVAKMAVIGADPAGVYQAAFYADDPFVGYYFGMIDHSCLELTPSPAGKEWLLLVGDYRLASAPDRSLAMNGYRLVHVPPSLVRAAPCRRP